MERSHSRIPRIRKTARPSATHTADRRATSAPTRARSGVRPRPASTSAGRAGHTTPVGGDAVKTLRKGSGPAVRQHRREKTGGVASTPRARTVSGATAGRAPAGTGGAVILRGKYGDRNRRSGSAPAVRRAAAPAGATPTPGRKKSAASSTASRPAGRSTSAARQAGTSVPKKTVAPPPDRRRPAASARRGRDERTPARRRSRYDDIERTPARTPSAHTHKRARAASGAARLPPPEQKNPAAPPKKRMRYREEEEKEKKTQELLQKRNQVRRGDEDDYDYDDGFVVPDGNNTASGSALDADQGVMDYPKAVKRKIRADAMKKLREDRLRSFLEPGDELEVGKENTLLSSQLGKKEEEWENDVFRVVKEDVYEDVNDGSDDDSFKSHSRHRSKHLRECEETTKSSSRPKKEASRLSSLSSRSPSRTKYKYRSDDDVVEKTRCPGMQKQKEREDARKNRTLGSRPKSILSKKEVHTSSSSSLSSKHTHNSQNDSHSVGADTNMARRVPKKQTEDKDSTRNRVIPKKQTEGRETTKSPVRSIPRKEASQSSSHNRSHSSSIPKRDISNSVSSSRIPSRKEHQIPSRNEHHIPRRMEHKTPSRNDHKIPSRNENNTWRRNENKIPSRNDNNTWRRNQRQ